MIAQVGYHEMNDGRWLRANDAAVAETPTEWPTGAKSGKKWIEVSVMDESLVLWEGQKPVYFTLISAGQDGLLAVGGDWAVSAPGGRRPGRCRGHI